MEQRVLIKSLREEGHELTQIHSKLVEHYGDKALSYPYVSYWVLQFCEEQESIEDSRRSGRPSDFQTRFRIEGALEGSPNPPVRDLAQTTSIAPSSVLYVLIQVLHLGFPNWRWTPHKLSDDQKQIRVQFAVSRQAELERAQQRNWTEFYTDHQSWVL
jgi:hypothetical protein